MAPRVTIAEAAAMAGCSVVDFRQVLEPLGFAFVEDSTDGNTSPAALLQASQLSEWLTAADDNHKDYFDVRKLIDSGDDPLKAILQRYGALPPGHLLCIINSFVPYPLIHLLEKKGAECTVDTKSSDLHYTWFFKGVLGRETERKPATSPVVMHDADSFVRIINLYPESRLQRLDVRHLPMPQPMQAVLETLPTLGSDEALYVRHKRVPLHLLDALEGQPYAIHIHEVGEGDVQLLVVRTG